MAIKLRGKCPDCDEKGHLVFDESTGNVLCENCFHTFLPNRRIKAQLYTKGRYGIAESAFRERTAPEAIPAILCPVCNKSFDSKGAFVNHMTAAEAWKGHDARAYWDDNAPGKRARAMRRGAKVAGITRATGGLWGDLIRRRIFSLIIVAILLSISLTFFSWISGLWLAFFFMFIYSMIPAESEIYARIGQRLAERKIKRSDEEIHDEMGSGERFFLMARVVLKFLIFVSFAVALGSIYPLIAFAVIFFGYFLFPTEYTINRPDKAIGSWLRVGVGIMLAMVVYQFLVDKVVSWNLVNPIYWISTFFSFFTGIGPIFLFIAIIFGVLATLFEFNRKWLLAIIILFLIMGGVTGGLLSGASTAEPGVLALFSIALAFFVVFPKKLEREMGEKSGITAFIAAKTPAQLAKVRKSIYYGSEGFGLGFFVILMILAIGDMATWGFDLFAGAGLTIFLIWLLSLIVGLFSGRENRPYMGVVMIGIAFVAFSFAFTGVLGSAMFGQFWPAVEHFGTNVLTPVGDAFGGITDSIGDTYLLITCPSCYYQEQAERSRTASQITPGGTAKSIESKFELIGGVSQIDPEFPLAGTIEVMNQGEFTANELIITLDTLWLRDPIEMTYIEITDVEPEFRSCSNGRIEGTGDYANDICVFDSANGGPIYPEDIRLLTFEYNDGSDHLGSVLRDCECTKFVACDEHDNEADCEGELLEDTGCYWEMDTCKGQGKVTELTQYSDCNMLSDCVGAGGSLGYTQAGNYTKLNFSYEFDYTVNVSLSVDILGKELFIERLQNKEITLDQKTSQYQGGPVRASIWTQKQPIQGDEPTFGEVSIINQMTGRVLDAKITLYSPVEFTTFGSHPLLICGTGIYDMTSDTYENPDTASLITNSDSAFYNYYSIQCKLEPGKILEREDVVRYKFDYTFTLGDYDEKTSILIGRVDYTYEGENSLELPIIQVPIQ